MFSELNGKQAEENQNWLKAYEFMKTKLGNMEEENNHLKVMMKKQKFPTISIDYLDKVSEDADKVVVFSIGKLVVGGTGSSKEIARENTAQCMFNMVENILVNEGTETLKEDFPIADPSKNFQRILTKIQFVQNLFH